MTRFAFLQKGFPQRTLDPRDRLIDERRPSFIKLFYTRLQSAEALAEFCNLRVKTARFFRPSCLSNPTNRSTSVATLLKVVRTCCGSRLIRESTASVIVEATLSARWLIFDKVRRPRMAATITSIDVPLISASSRWSGNLHNRARSSFLKLSGSGRGSLLLCWRLYPPSRTSAKVGIRDRLHDSYCPG